MTRSSAVDPQANRTSTPQETVPYEEKAQPWRAVWPAPRESQSQAQIFGFKRGEIMVFDGNAGNFFPKKGWTVEQECQRQ
ncbi:hypothetical protein ACLMJK_006484 [Lecanora helva]